MLYTFCFVCIICVIFSLLARKASLVEVTILLITCCGLGFTIAGLLTPVENWEMKYVYSYFGAISLCFIAPFLVIFRGSISGAVAASVAAGLVAFTSLAIWQVFMDVQKGFSLGGYLFIVVPAFLIGWAIASIAWSFRP